MNPFKKIFLLIVCATGCSVAIAGPVNVNTADAQTISDELTGVGLSRANAIVEYRKTNGPFRSAEELLNVKGIGERTLAMNADNILLEAPSRKAAK